MSKTLLFLIATVFLFSVIYVGILTLHEQKPELLIVTCETKQSRVYWIFESLHALETYGSFSCKSAPTYIWSPTIRVLEGGEELMLSPSLRRALEGNSGRS